MSFVAASCWPWVCIWYIVLHKMLPVICPVISIIVLWSALFLCRNRQPLFISEAMKMVIVHIFTVVRLCSYMLSKYILLFLFSKIRFAIKQQDKQNWRFTVIFAGQLRVVFQISIVKNVQIQVPLHYLKSKVKVKVKVNVLPITGHEGPEEEKRYSPTLSWPPYLEGGGWSAPRPGRFTPRKTRYPLYRRLGRPQGRSGMVRKISPPPGFDPRTSRP